MKHGMMRTIQNTVAAQKSLVAEQTASIYASLAGIDALAVDAAVHADNAAP